MEKMNIKSLTTLQENVEYGDLITIQYESTSVGCTREANVILPPAYQADTTYPLLILLHGIGGDQNEWLYGKPREIIGNLIHLGKTIPMITVIPNVRARFNDEKDPADIFTLEHFKAFDYFKHDLQNDLLPYLKKHYKISEDRHLKAIAGLSMGGREALYIGLTMQETFGSIGAFSPAFGLLPYKNMDIVEEGLLKKEGFQLEDPYKDTFITIISGKEDEVISREPFRYHQALSDNKVDHIYEVVPGGHDFEVWSYGLSEFLKAIFS